MLTAVPHHSAPSLLTYRPPFDWPAMLEYLGPRATPGTEAVHAGRYWRTMRVGAHTGVAGVSHDVESGALRIFLSPGLAPMRTEITSLLRHLFDIDADPLPIVEHLAGDPRLTSLVRQRPGLRVPGAVNGFELAVRAILGQQVSVRGATTLAGRLAMAVGEPLDRAVARTRESPQLTHLAPTPERMADAGVDAIARIGLPRARAATLVHLARAVADRTIGDLSPSPDSARVAEQLLELPGIGPWTVQYVALRALRDPDAFPESDLGLRKAMGGMRVVQLRQAAERWRPWRGYAAIHLWTSLTRSDR